MTPVPGPFGPGAAQQLISSVTPVFKAEGPDLYAQAYARNQQFAKPGSYTTKLTPAQEIAFRQWVVNRKVPFDPHAKITDYDMRGYWLDTNGGVRHAPGQHFPDTYKTPYDTTFSNQSKYATKNNPFVWRGNKLVDSRNGQVVFKST